MPSSKNYQRDTKQEWKTAKERGEDDRNRERHRVRYRLEQEGKVKPFDGKDVAHVQAKSKGGSDADSNLRIEPKGKNRSFARNPDGSIKSETSKREKK